MSDRIEFTVNGDLCSVGSEIKSDVTLNDYLRKHLNLRGTKYMCRQGACGACVVSVTARNPITEEYTTFSVNSCLPIITSCKDWQITTIEGLGNRKKGYHPIQETFSKFGATQCGYCTPGWVMGIYSLTEEEKKISKSKIEDSFGGHICRCTGYRPILDALKSFSCDNCENGNSSQCGVADIEDLNITCRNDPRKRKPLNVDDDWFFVNKKHCEQEKNITIIFKDDKKWFRVNTIKEVFYIFDRESDCMLLAGNTGKGVYPDEDVPNSLIDISAIKALKGYTFDQNLIIGAGNTLTDMVKIFNEVSAIDYFEYLTKFEEHMRWVSHTSVKNIGTIAGNLMLKHNHNSFASDIFLLLETVGASITIQSKNKVFDISLLRFLQLDMHEKIIVNVKLPPLNNKNFIVTYKIMPRSQNAEAIVNAGFLYHIFNTKIQHATLVFGGVSATFSHATNTEQFLCERNIFKNCELQNALEVLSNELTEALNVSETSSVYRKKMCLGLFYKSLLEISPPGIVNNVYKSGALNLRKIRPVSQGLQIYDTNENIWPLNKPITKIEGLIQSSGEVKYVDDIPTLPREVFAAFVLSTVSNGEIASIDVSEALDINGVIAFYSAKDIPGMNSFTPVNNTTILIEEELLCNGKVKFYNQPIGIIVAESEDLAQKAAKKVEVTYKNVSKPILTIRKEMITKKRIELLHSISSKEKGLDVKNKFSGTGNIYSQYPMSLETQVCLTQPNEDGIEVRASTQWIDVIQAGVSKALKIPQNRVTITMPLVGGAFGGKVTRQAQTAVSCSLVTYMLNRPCRFITPVSTAMRALGNRFPCSLDYEVEVSNKGEIQYMKFNIYEDHGYTINEPIPQIGMKVIGNCYKKYRWDINIYNVITDTPKKSWLRSPGSLEQIAMTELIMERISYEMLLDPFTVRFNNLLNDSIIKELILTLKTQAHYADRRIKVDKFNNSNKWKKRGLRFTPMIWPIHLVAKLTVNVAVYRDGSVVITHGGIEMGQGINTKVIQVCAYTLNIPIENVKIKGSSTISNPNSDVSAASITSESACYGVIQCCGIILNRLEPLKQDLGDVGWEQLIKIADSQGVNLFANYLVTPKDQKEYSVYGVTMSEVEVDTLTGEIIVLRVDIFEDVGQSLSPKIDVGQLEGAFVMGMGYWTSENLVYDDNGELLTDRPWTYYVPLAKDIPIDFRIYFRRGSFNHDGVLGSKATGEPAICMSVSVAFAIREAIAAARLDKGIPLSDWFNMDGPCTNENIVTCIDAQYKDFKFN